MSAPARTLPERTETAALVALKRRLATGELTTDDRTALARAMRLKQLRAEGKSFDECAVEMQDNAKALSSLSRRDSYDAFCAYIDAANDTMDERAMQRAIRRGRIEIAGLVPETVRQLRECYRRHPAGTKIMRGNVEVDVSDELIDKGDAGWASQLVVKGTGLLEPTAAPAPTLVNPTFINQTIYMSRGDDDQAAEAARVAIDVTPERT